MRWIRHFLGVDYTLLWCWLFYFVEGNSIKIREPLKDESVVRGDTISFMCDAVINSQSPDPPQLRMRWKHNGVNLDTKSAKYQLMDDGQMLIIRDIDFSDGGDYTCIAGLRGQSEKVKSTAKLTVKGPPDPPQNVEISNCGGHQVELIWEDGDNGGESILSYLVQYNTTRNPYYWSSAHEEVVVKTLPKVKSKSAWIPLAPWGQYSFRILAKNSLGYSEPSRHTRTMCNTPPERPRGNPEHVKTKTDKEGKLIITWDPMPKMQHNAPNFGYLVSWRKKGSTYWHEKFLDQVHTQLEVDVDDVYGLYQVKVQAKNSIGPSYQPPFLYIGHSGEAKPKIKPRDFRVDLSKSLEPHKAHFIWEAVNPNADEIKGKFRGYKIQYWKSSEGRRNKVEVPIIIEHGPDFDLMDVRASISNLQANTAFRGQVSVMNGHHSGPPSETIDFRTSEGVPGPVRDLQQEDIGTTHALLKWNPPDEPNGLLLGYDIGYQPVNGDVMGEIRALKPRIDNPSTTSARITGLKPNHKYRFYIWSRTGAGRGEKSGIDVLTKGNQKFYREGVPGESEMHYSNLNIATGTWNINIGLVLLLVMTALVATHVFH